MSWYFAALRKYADFTGRARRKEYWLYVLFNLIVGLVLRALLRRIAHAIPGGGQDRNPVFREVHADGLYLTEETGQADDPPICFLKLPVTKGRKRTTVTEHRDTSTFEVVREVGETKVIGTSAGKFEAVPVTLEGKDPTATRSSGTHRSSGS